MREPDFGELAYGRHSMQRLDIYLPGGTGRFPTVVLIHGGGFYCCDKRDFHRAPVNTFLEMGFAVAAVNYRMAPAFPFPFPQRDIGRAIRWLQSSGARFGLDKDALLLHGTSAGGNLAAVEALRAKARGGIRAAALLCPVVAVSTLTEDLAGSALAEAEHLAELEKIRRLYLGGQRDLRADADFYIADRPDARVPFYIQHGSRDRLVALRQSEEFVRKLRAAGWDRVFLEVLDGEDHAREGGAFYRPEAVRRVGEFFLGCLNGKREGGVCETK